MFVSMRSIRLRILFILSLLISYSSLLFASQNPLICITQIVAHPALDTTRRGIVDELSAAGYVDGESARVRTQNAQGQISTAIQIASKCQGAKADVIVALGTPMAQSAMKVAKSVGIPLVFSSITDPLGAKLVTRLKSPGGVVTGVSNATSRDAQLDLFLEMNPKMKRLGVIVNPSDANSLAAYKLLLEAAKKRGVTLVQGVASKTTELSQAAKSLVPQVDALFVDNDNTALSGFASIAKVALAQKMPLFVSDTDMVPQGALAALGPDQYEIGRQTGKMVVRILKGEDPGKIDVAFPQENVLVVNEEVARKIGVTFPKSLLLRMKK